jgi:outer membrane protein OmpA-like peptidoglycan-associated protein
MRITRLLLVFSASMILAAPTNAQQGQAPAPAPTRSVDDYVCAFAGECVEQPRSDDSIEAPDTKGFRLSVPESRAGADSRATTTKSGGVTAGTGNKQRTAKKAGGQAPARGSATQPRRMDLRVSFLLGSAELTPQAQEEVKVFAKALLLPELAARRFRIEGHTDSTGGRAMNLDLSRRRAQSVADYLAGLGVQSNRLQVRGYGPDRPLLGHRPSSPENRRVEAQLL